jgi:hypothetical protein
MELSIYCELTPIGYASVLMLSEGYIREHDVKLVLPELVMGLKIRSMMDAVLYKVFPRFEGEIVDFYKDRGESLRERYGVRGCRVLDLAILNWLKFEFRYRGIF